MLFTYKYIAHKIEKLQEHLNFLFFNVWLPADGDFNFNKLNGKSELKEICERLEIEDTEWGIFFNRRITIIFDEFAKIKDSAFKTRLKQLYINNNNIEGLCVDKQIEPVTYKEIENHYPDLAKALKSFYERLYGRTSPFNLKAFGFLDKKLIYAYDKQFMINNIEEICPFCGTNHLKGNNHSHREAYDHFIPKGLYPFSNVNFKNLAPMCHECNSTYKLTKIPIFNNDEKNIDPILKAKQRSFAFYPYSKEHPRIVFNIELKTTDIANLKPEHIDLYIEADGYDEQIDSWKRVFGIEERYKALLSSKNAGRSWFNSILDEFENAQLLSDIENAEQYYNIILRDAKKTPLSNHGFIKSVFLEECKRKGLFEIH